MRMVPIHPVGREGADLDAFHTAMRILQPYAGAGRPLRQAGAILGGSLPSHKARLKLMLLLGAGADLRTVRESFESQP